MGSAPPRFACGRGITWTETSSPTRRAAAAPASVAALTAATSPRTMAVTYPAPIFSQPTSVTFAAFTIASAASIIATRPFVSTMPSASPMPNLLWGGVGDRAQTYVGVNPRRRLPQTLDGFLYERGELAVC